MKQGFPSGILCNYLPGLFILLPERVVLSLVPPTSATKSHVQGESTYNFLSHPRIRIQYLVTLSPNSGHFLGSLSDGLRQ